MTVSPKSLINSCLNCVLRTTMSEEMSFGTPSTLSVGAVFNIPRKLFFYLIRLFIQLILQNGLPFHLVCGQFSMGLYCRSCSILFYVNSVIVLKDRFVVGIVKLVGLFSVFVLFPTPYFDVILFFWNLNASLTPNNEDFQLFLPQSSQFLSLKHYRLKLL